MNLIEKINQSFNSHLEQQFKQTIPFSLIINLDESKKNFGDLNSNAAMVLAKELKQNPKVVAQQIIDSFTHPAVAKMEVAGPGFLNIFLTSQAYQQLAQELYRGKDRFFRPNDLKKKNYSLEFVSANPTGPLHIGHGRGGIIGDVLGNVLRFSGHQVTKEFYINDAGNQIKKLGSSLKIRCQQLTGLDIELPEDAYHGDYLTELAKQCIKEHGPDVVQKPDEFFGLYAQDHLLDDIKKTLAAYGITFDVWFSEKTLHASGAIERELKKLTKNEYTYEKEGALWFKSTEFGDDKDRILRKTNGELTYVAADIAYLDNKIDRGANHLIMILGQDHHSYVARLKGLLKAMGHNPDMLDVILYQLVSIKESGKLVRMSKRAGRIITLTDVIETVGTDVARFFYLNRKADAHLDFDIDLALKKTDENPVYYIQYAYVRTNSILEKAQAIAELSDINETDALHLTESEAQLIKKMVSLKELLQSIDQHYQTHLLTYYILELAQDFHSYYAAHKVIDQQNISQSRARLLIIQLIRDTFELVLDLLGISKPVSM